jgi:hypothetical protein
MHFRGDDFDLAHSHVAQFICDPVGGLFDVVLVLGFCAYAWDAQKLAEFLQMRVTVRFDVVR